MNFSNWTLIIILVIVACNNEKKISESNSSKYKKVISLDHGIEVRFKEQEGDANLYFGTEIYNKGKLICKDTISEYELRDDYPQIRKINTQLELLMIVNDRPSISKTELFILKDTQVELRKVLPFFQTKPKDIDNDGKEEVFGIMYPPEIIGKQSELMSYCPILVYENDNKLHVDSLTTRNLNKEIYGGFYGYESSFNHTFSLDVYDEFQQYLTGEK